VSYRQSQNPAYWTTAFQLTQEDIDHLHSYALERNRPLNDKELAEALIEYRVQREEQRIQRELSRGALYQPKDDYEVGDKLVFSARDFALGTVTAKRPGRNPEHGEFSVITVDIEGEDKDLDFAAGLNTPHKLNRAADDGGLQQADATSPEELIHDFGPEVRTRLREPLLASPEPEFTALGHYWLPADLLVEVHVGHLNIAEAAIDVQERPLVTAELLRDMDFPGEVPAAIAAYSLDRGLAGDDRFVDVGVEGREWYLRRLLPEEAINTPRRLQYVPEPYDRSPLGVTMLQLEWELDDEWTEGGATSVSVAQIPSVSLMLIYPHRRSGTLPLSNRTASFFPVREGKRSMITLVDGRWGNRFPGWVIPEARYVCGLREWYEAHDLPVGAYVVLERSNDPAEIVVDFKPRRMRREWVRMARVVGNELEFQLQKQAVQCEYDEEMIVAEADAEAIDRLRRSLHQARPSVADMVLDIAPKLMGLSTQGTVHAKTIYSAVNLLRRTPPGPIFTTLAISPQFQEMGGGYFAMARP
jgi:hypothetical protein